MRGGGKPYLPLPPEVQDARTFQQAFDLLSITAHGAQDGYSFIVPDNVFICFRGPSGATIERRKKQDELLNQFRYKNPGETNDAYYERIYTAVKNKTLFKDFLAPPEDPFKPGSMSIYEPGDLIQNIVLQMHNLHYPYGLIGTWKMPLPHEYLQEIDSLNYEFEEMLNEQMELKKQEILQQVSLADPTLLNLPKASIDKVLTPFLEKETSITRNELNELFKQRELDFSHRPENFMHFLGLSEDATLYDVLQTMRRSVLGHAPAVSKPYVFIVIEACREAFELQQVKLLAGEEHITALEHRGNEAERIAALEHATTKFYKGSKNVIASTSLAIGNALKPSRRRSIAVRNFPEACFTSLFLLSRPYLQTLLETASPEHRRILEQLFAGQKIPSHILDAITAPSRAVNTALLNLPYIQRFYPGEGVNIQGTPGIIKNVKLAGNSVQYIVATPSTTLQLNPKNIQKMNQEEFQAIRMSMGNANQAVLTYTRAKPTASIAPVAIRNRNPVGELQGKTFFIRPELLPLKTEIERALDASPFKGNEDVYIKYVPTANKAKQPLGGKGGFLTGMLDYVDRKGVKQLKYEVQFNDGNPNQYFFADFLVRSSANVGKAKNMAGGRYTRYRKRVLTSRRKGKGTRKGKRLL